MDIYSKDLIDQTSSYVLKKNWKNLYVLGMDMFSLKGKICLYLIHHINPVTNYFRFTIKGLTNKFNCSHHTVYSAINSLKNNKYIKLGHNYDYSYISFNGYHSLYAQKGGDIVD